MEEEKKEEVKVEEKQLGVKELLEKIAVNQDTIIKTKKQKEWKLPWNARVNNGFVKKNYGTFAIINDNKEVKFLRAQISDGTVDIDGIPRLALANYAMTYKGKPFYMIPTWSLKPFSPEKNVEETYTEKMNVSGRRVILAKLEKEAIKPKGNMNGGMIMWIILGLVVLGAAYYFIKGGKLF